MTTMINRPTGALREALRKAESVQRQLTVPPRQVRRIHGSDAFVTDLRVIGQDTFEVGVRLPAWHRFYGPMDQRTHDPLLILECMRQAGLAVAHLAYETPREFKFLVHDKSFEVDPAGLRTNGAEPVDILINVTAHDIRRRSKWFAGMRFKYTCFRDDQLIATGSYRWSCVSPAAYDKLRGPYRDAQPAVPSGSALVRPQLVGRRNEVNVMLAEVPEWPGLMLHVDPAHPVVFDHSIEHVPGSAVIEAARQAGLLVVGRPDAMPIRGDLTFLHYIEFDKPCMVFAEAHPEPADDATATVGVAFTQGDRTAAQGTIDLLVRA